MAQISSHRRIAGLIAGSLAAALAAAVSPAGPASAADHTVAVALFYAPTPVATYSGLVPEEYASADISTRLAAGSAGRFAIVPRDHVRAEESGLRWREWDALRFARLGELARAVGADRLVVGWIQSLVLDRLGGGGNNFDVGGGDGGGVLAALAVVIVQVFDASEERIVYQTKVEGHALGAIPAQVVQSALDDAVRRAAVQLPDPLTAASGSL
jgi:curli biogenesis system outer membrane secretion channel CsgG